jgi:hypothetical protein
VQTSTECNVGHRHRLLSISLVVAWLVPYLNFRYAPPLIAAAFLLSYLLSFAWGGIWWIKGINAGAPS